MARTDGDSKAVAPRAGSKVYHFLGLRVVALSVANFIFHTGQHTEFTFNGYIELVSVVNHLLREGNVFFVGKAGAVNHHRAEAHVDATLASFKRITVVKMQHDFRMLAAQFLGILHSTFCHVAQQSLVSVSTSALRNLQNNRAFLLRRSLDDGLQLLHVVEVESRNCITASDGTLEHVARVDQA